METIQMNQELVAYIRDVYKPGDRVELLSMKGEPHMPKGLQGTITGVDDMGQIHVNWDTGSTLALILDEDDFIKLDILTK